MQGQETTLFLMTMNGINKLNWNDLKWGKSNKKCSEISIEFDYLFWEKKIIFHLATISQIIKENITESGMTENISKN